MTNTLTKEKLCERLYSKFFSEPSFQSKATIMRLIESILKEIKGRLEGGEPVHIMNFGTWLVRNKKSRLVRNPVTGERIEILPRIVILFHPVGRLRKIVK